MFKYTLLNNPWFTLNKNILINIFSEIEKVVDRKQNWILNIVFVTENEIKEYNNKYRNIDKSTDVLSFHYFDSFDISDDEIAWEILMCEQKILLQWKEFWLWTEKEFYKLLIHSVLHILWYDHEEDKDYEIMRTLEEEIWKIII